MRCAFRLFLAALAVMVLGVMEPAAAQEAAKAEVKAEGKAKPVWDLRTAEIRPELTVGEVVRNADGTVSLNGRNAFAVPAEAFPDAENFTVVIRAKFGPRNVGESFPLLRKHGEAETGFEYVVNQLPWNHIQLGTRITVNGMVAEGRGIREPNDTECSFTLAVRNGCPSFYFNDFLGRRCFVQMLPNDEPFWVGACSEGQIEKGTFFKDVTITELKVFGANYAYVCPHEPKEDEPRGAVMGKGWTIDAPQVADPNRPHILIFGDSISMGYRGALIDGLKGKVYVDHFCGFVSNTCNTKAFTEAAGNRQYAMIFFNNGLHSLHWTPDQVSDEEIANRTRDIVRSFRAGSPNARLFWLTTTPHTAQRPAPGKPVEALGELNPIVLRINRIAERVMKEEGVEIIDVYSPLAKRLDLANGDGYHWNSQACQIIADAVAAKTREGLKIQ